MSPPPPPAGNGARPAQQAGGPPHNLDAEESLLGAALLAPATVLDEVRHHVSPDDFYHPANAHIWAAIGRLAEQGRPVDPVLVADALEQAGLLDDIGGPAVLLDYQARTPAISNASRYAEIVTDCARRRRVQALAADLTAAAANGAVYSPILDQLEALTTTTPAGLLDGMRTGDWLQKQEFPPLNWHLPNIIPEGLTLLVGAPKIGKSWLVLHLALAVANAGRALGLKVDAHPVLYLALEDGDRRMQARCRTLLAGDPIPPGFCYLTTLEPGAVTDTIAQWLDQAVDQSPDSSPLVIVDTLGKVMPPAVMGESAYQRDYRVAGRLKHLADSHPGTALVVNHHDRKADSDDFVDRVSGTNGLAGAADTIAVLTRPRHETTGLLAVTGRDIDEREYAVTFHGPTGLWTLKGGSLTTAAAHAAQQRAGEGLDDRSLKIIAHVANHPNGARANDVATALDIDAKQAGTYLGRLADTGRITRLARGLYGPIEATTSDPGPGSDSPDQLTDQPF